MSSNVSSAQGKGSVGGSNIRHSSMYGSSAFGSRAPARPATASPALRNGTQARTFAPSGTVASNATSNRFAAEARIKEEAARAKEARAQVRQQRQQRPSTAAHSRSSKPSLPPASRAEGARPPVPARVASAALSREEQDLLAQRAQPAAAQGIWGSASATKAAERAALSQEQAPQLLLGFVRAR